MICILHPHRFLYFDEIGKQIFVDSNMDHVMDFLPSIQYQKKYSRKFEHLCCLSLNRRTMN